MDISGYFNTVLSRFVPRESDWKFVTSAGAMLSVATPVAHLGVVGAGGALWVKRDADPSPTRLTFGSIGGTLGLSLIPSPVNFSFSIPEMPSSGTLYSLFAAGRTLTRDELSGAMIAYEVGADFGPGVSGCLMFIGGNWSLASAVMGPGAALAIPVLVASSKAVVRFGGMTATVLPANVSGNFYIGYIH